MKNKITFYLKDGTWIDTETTLDVSTIHEIISDELKWLRYKEEDGIIHFINLNEVQTFTVEPIDK